MISGAILLILLGSALLVSLVHAYYSEHHDQ
jgi:hypothetical protein